MARNRRKVGTAKSEDPRPPPPLPGDQTFLGRDEGGATEALLVRDAMVPRTLGLSIGAPASGDDVVHLLERVAAERGAWPFAIQMDNGPENKNAPVARSHRARARHGA